MDTGAVLISGRSESLTSNDYDLILTCLTCRRSCVLGFAGVAPTLEQVEWSADAHKCGEDSWRVI